MQGGEFSISTSRRMDLVDITPQVSQALVATGAGDGLCFLYNPHTTAGLTINEGADPAVQSDLIGVFKQMVPLNYPYRHQEGNSPSHMMTTLTGSSAAVFIESGRLQLGTWQRIFFCEYDGPRNRKVWWKILQG